MDFTQFLDRITPQSDGEAAVRYRTATVLTRDFRECSLDARDENAIGSIDIEVRQVPTGGHSSIGVDCWRLPFEPKR